MWGTKMCYLFLWLVFMFWTFIVSTWGGNCDSKRNAQNYTHCRELASSSCSCSLDWLTHTVMGQHICSWHDKVKFNCCYFHNECISCISFKKLDDTAISVREVRNWNMNVTFSCEEQPVSSRILFFLSGKLWHCKCI